jgi:predicted PurR-regulated permease PerM
MFDGAGAGLANLMSYPVLIGAILIFIVSLVILFTKKTPIRKGIKGLLTVAAVFSGASVLFLTITMFAFGSSNREITDPMLTQTMMNEPSPLIENKRYYTERDLMDQMTKLCQNEVQFYRLAFIPADMEFSGYTISSFYIEIGRAHV